MIRIIGVCLLVIFIMNTNVFAKCPLVKLHIIGAVKSGDLKTGVKDAQIFVFLDTSQSTNSAGYATKYPDFVNTDSNGKFISTNYFDSFEKRTFIKGDVCSEKPTKLEIIIVKPGFKTKRNMFDIKDLNLVEDEGILKLILPEIILEK